MKTKMKNLFLTLLAALVLPQMAAAADFVLKKTSGTYQWNAANSWTNNAVPGEGSIVVLGTLSGARTLDLNGASTPAVGQVRNDSADVTVQNGTLNFAASGNEPLRPLWIRNDGVLSTYKDLTLSFVMRGAVYPCILVDGNAQVVFDNVKTSNASGKTLPNIAFIELQNAKQNAKITFKNTNTEFARFLASDSAIKGRTRAVDFVNSTVRFGSWNKQISRTTGDASTTNATDRIAVGVKLGSANQDKAAIDVTGTARFAVGSTLAIDTTAVGIGTYKVFRAGTLTAPTNLAVSLVPHEGDKLPLIMPVFNRETDLVLYAGDKKYTFTVDGKKELSLTIADSDLGSVMTDGSGSVYGYVLYDAAKREYANVYTKTETDLTWTVPAGVTSFDYYVVGGGGGGGGCGTYDAAGGGGAGAVITGRVASAVAQCTIKVGKGGGSSGSAEKSGASGDFSLLSVNGVEFVKAAGGGGGACKSATAGSGGSGGGKSNYQGSAGSADTSMSTKPDGAILLGNSGGGWQIQELVFKVVLAVAAREKRGA